MNQKKIFFKIIFFNYFVMSIHAMEEDRGRVPALKKIAAQRLKHIFQNELTLDNEPKWILKEPPNELKIQINQDLIRNNGIIWWSCFKELARTFEIGSINSIFLALVSKKSDLLLIACHKSAGIFVKIFNIEKSELFLEGFFEEFNSLLGQEVELLNLQGRKCSKINICELFPDILAFLYKSNLAIKKISIKQNSNKLRFLKFRSKEISSFNYFYVPLIKYNSQLNLEKYEKYLQELHKDGYNTRAFLFKGFHNCKNCIAIKVPNKSLVVTASGDQTVKLWNLKTCECVYSIKHDYKFNFEKPGVWLNFDGTLLFIKISDNTLILCNTETGRIVEKFIEDKEIALTSMNSNNNILMIAVTADQHTKIKISRINYLLDNLNFAQLSLIRLICQYYQKNGYAKICTNSIWNRILKYFDSNIQQLIFEKFNLRISCDDLK